MAPDNEGFKYPVVDRENCVECGLCERSCLVINVKLDKKFEQTEFVVQHTDDSIRHESTAGGAFTAIASWIIHQGGTMYGASYDTDFMVEHSCTDTFEGLVKFRNSKYVQGDTKTHFWK